MKVLLVDDESAMLLAMKMLLAKMEDVELVGAFQSANAALEFVEEGKEVDLAFLDIELAGDSGLELARRLRMLHAGLDIVFTTSHTDFAMQAYDVYPLDYMVKPILRTRLTQTIARAAARRSASPAQNDEDTANRLSIIGLGCFEASGRQTGAVKWISRKSMELFAYLLIHQGRSISKMRVLDDLFPEMPFKNAETYLYTAVYQLRKALSEHGCKHMVVSVQEKYRMDADGAHIDFIQFERQVQAFSEINASNAAAAVQLERKYTGELFDGASFNWAVAERERLNLLYESFAKRLAEWLLGQKQYREASTIAGRLARFNAYDEETRLLQMSIHGAMGDLSSLQASYDSYKEMVCSELNISPSPQIEQLYRQYM